MNSVACACLLRKSKEIFSLFTNDMNWTVTLLKEEFLSPIIIIIIIQTFLNRMSSKRLQQFLYLNAHNRKRKEFFFFFHSYLILFIFFNFYSKKRHANWPCSVINIEWNRSWHTHASDMWDMSHKPWDRLCNSPTYFFIFSQTQSIPNQMFTMYNV